MLLEFFNIISRSLLDYCIKCKQLNNCEHVLNYLFNKENSPLSSGEAKALIYLLNHHYDDNVLIKTLSIIANAVAFSKSADYLCYYGCTHVFPKLLRNSSIAVQISTLNAISNMANTEMAQDLMKPLIAPIISLLKISKLQLHLESILMALCNLAHRESNHCEFIDSLDLIMNFLQDSINSTRNKLQAAKLLVNLSCNQFTIPYLLKSNVTNNFIALFEISTDEALLLRLCLFLLNLAKYAKKNQINTNDLAKFGPNALYISLFDVKHNVSLIESLKRLLNHPNSEIKSNTSEILLILDSLLITG